jgi:hypothetical protein
MKMLVPISMMAPVRKASLRKQPKTSHSEISGIVYHKGSTQIMLFEGMSFVHKFRFDCPLGKIACIDICLFLR